MVFNMHQICKDDYTLEPEKLEPELYRLHQEIMHDLHSLPDYKPTPPDVYYPPLSILYVSTVISPIRRLYSWAIPDRSALNMIAQCSPNGVVEIGAGTGYWASLLKANGIPTMAYDLRPCAGELHNGHHSLDLEGTGVTRENVPAFTSVEEGGAEEAALHPEKTLLLCYPPPEQQDKDLPEATQNTMAVDSIQAFRGDTVVYVGTQDGSTAGAQFHSHLQQHWNLRHQYNLPRWPSSQDTLQVWKRRDCSPLSLKASTTPTSARSSKERTILSESSSACSLAAAAGEAEAVRAAVMRRSTAAFQEGAMAFLLQRIRQGGPGARSGLERVVVDALYDRSPFFKRLLLRVLKAR